MTENAWSASTDYLNDNYHVQNNILRQPGFHRPPECLQQSRVDFPRNRLFVSQTGMSQLSTEKNNPRQVRKVEGKAVFHQSKNTTLRFTKLAKTGYNIFFAINPGTIKTKQKHRMKTRGGETGCRRFSNNIVETRKKKVTKNDLALVCLTA